MASILEFHPDAVDEARVAREWYADRSESASFGFVAELDRVVAAIAEAPSRCSTYLHGTRRCLFRRYPFFVVYRVQGEIIQVIAVAHGRRRPGYWRERQPPG